MKELFHEVSKLKAEDRAVFLNKACDGDADVLREVELLLDQHSHDGILDWPVGELLSRSTVMPLLSGTLVGQYRIEEHVGAGGMGTVYKATDTKLGRAVALKMLHPEMLEDPSSMARFEREARTLASLNHQHIGLIYGFEAHHGVRFLALEYVPGPTLAERLRRRALPIREAVLIAEQIAEALEAAHAKGIIHRDLKPANIKVDESGQVKVLDFGLAKPVEQVPALLSSDTTQVTERPTGKMAIVGTPAYMSPEHASGKSLDSRTDVWAFGCVLYEMLTGKQAFARATVTETLAAVLEREPDWSALPRMTPDSVRRLLRRCMEKDAKRRVHHIADARIELEELLSVRPVLGLHRAKVRTGLFAAAGAALLLAALSAYFFLNTGVRRTRKGDAPDAFANVTERQITTNPIENPINFAAISPDGKYVAYSDATAIRLRLIDTGETRVLSVPGGL